MSFFTRRQDLPAHREAALRVPERSRHELLAITPDTRFFASVLSLFTPGGWTVKWARSVTGAVYLLERRTIPIVLYDWYSTVDDWQPAIRRLILIGNAPCVILAAPRVDEVLWRRAIGNHVYDVVCRTGASGHLAATLQFAWSWRVERKMSNYLRAIAP